MGGSTVFQINVARLNQSYCRNLFACIVPFSLNVCQVLQELPSPHRATLLNESFLHPGLIPPKTATHTFRRGLQRLVYDNPLISANQVLGRAALGDPMRV